MTTKRIIWIDWLKILAIIGVIGIHISSQYLNPEIVFTGLWYEAVVIASTFRYAIILFIMASGYLLLRHNQDITSTPRRIKRVIIPFSFYLLIYTLVKVILVWHRTPDILELIQELVGAILDPTRISIQFWYVYMIIGLYLVTPILSKWIQHSTRREIRITLYIWIALSLLQFTTTDTIIPYYLKYLTGPIGYYILGYYLATDNNPKLENNKTAVLLIITGILVTAAGTILLSLITGQQSLHFIQLGDITPGACLEAVGLFLLVKNTDFTGLNTKINKLITNTSKDVYGIYLSNMLIIRLLEKIGIIPVSATPLLNTITSMALVLTISYILTELMARIPPLRPFSGVNG